jgi:hypothetical protein
MTWEYMDALGYRYETVAKEPLDGLSVVDLCSGNTGLYDLVKERVKSYRACDLRTLHKVVEQLPDDEFVDTLTECDVLCVFGHGGWDITREPLESSTLTNSIHKVIKKFSPKIVVLECVSKFEPIIEPISYHYTRERIYTPGSNWLTDRVLYIQRK